MARDLGPRGITVNIVQPGSTNTDMNPANGPTYPNSSAAWQFLALAKPQISLDSSLGWRAVKVGSLRGPP
jgi:NAD(P)-dependent dehydrogenase (short-subunit alcohol dehydrogenase family)